MESLSVHFCYNVRLKCVSVSDPSLRTADVLLHTVHSSDDKQVRRSLKCVWFTSLYSLCECMRGCNCISLRSEQQLGSRRPQWYSWCPPLHPQQTHTHSAVKTGLTSLRPSHTVSHSQNILFSPLLISFSFPRLKLSVVFCNGLETAVVLHKFPEQKSHTSPAIPCLYNLCTCVSHCTLGPYSSQQLPPQC